MRDPRLEEGEEEPLRSAVQQARALTAAVTETRAIFRLADEAYAPYSCPASGECCRLAVTGRQPWLWPAEVSILERALAAQDRDLPPERGDGACPLLDATGQRCSVYADRPFGCRTYFCDRIVGPRRQPAETVIALSKRLEAVARRVDPEAVGPRPLLECLQSARR